MKIIKDDETRAVRRRVIVTSISVAVALVVLLFVPVPISVKTACVIDGANKVRVTASTPGFLSEIPVRDGTIVARDQLLAVLRNPDLEKSLHQIRLAEESAQASEAEAISRQLDKRIPSLRALASQYALASAKYSRDLANLQIHAPVAGIVMAPDLRYQRGLFLREGGLVCEILPEGPLEAVVALSEKESGLVQKSQKVSFRIHSLPGKSWQGAVLSVSPLPSIELPHQALGQQAGGTVPSSMAAPGVSRGDNTPVALASSQVYKARIAIENPGGLLRPGMAGRLKISCGTKPLGQWIANKFRDMLRSDFQL